MLKRILAVFLGLVIAGILLTGCGSSGGGGGGNTSLEGTWRMIETKETHTMKVDGVINEDESYEDTTSFPFEITREGITCIAQPYYQLNKGNLKIFAGISVEGLTQDQYEEFSVIEGTECAVIFYELQYRIDGDILVIIDEELYEDEYERWNYVINKNEVLLTSIEVKEEILDDGSKEESENINTMKWVKDTDTILSKINDSEEFVAFIGDFLWGDEEDDMMED